jgi:hypothetical protein
VPQAGLGVAEEELFSGAFAAGLADSEEPPDDVSPDFVEEVSADFEPLSEPLPDEARLSLR